MVIVDALIGLNTPKLEVPTDFRVSIIAYANNLYIPTCFVYCSVYLFHQLNIIVPKTSKQRPTCHRYTLFSSPFHPSSQHSQRNYTQEYIDLKHCSFFKAKYV